MTLIGACRRNSSDQTISNGYLQFPTSEYNSGISTQTNQYFQIPSDGYYQVTAVAQVINPMNQAYRPILSVRLDGTDIGASILSLTKWGSEYDTLHMSTELPLETGNQVSAHMRWMNYEYQYGTGTIQNCHFFIRKVWARRYPVAVGILRFEDSEFAQPYSDLDVTIETTFDNLNSFPSTAGHYFSIPTTGYYALSFVYNRSDQFGSRGQLQLKLKKNDTTIRTLYGINCYPYYQLQWSWEGRLVAGDYYNLTFYNNTANQEGNHSGRISLYNID